MFKPVLSNQRYQFEEELGAGGMGTVYRAFDRLTQTPVAIKRLNMSADFLSYLAETSSDSSLVSLAHEFETLASLRHPHIISVLDYGFDDAQSPYLVMEYLADARPLTRYAQAKPEKVVGSLLIDLLQALAYLHRRGVIHRDIKPDNVLVSDGRLKVLDFGLATAHGAAGELVGTLSYIAPEILQEQPASQQSDLYAVGVIAYRIFAGQLPFAEHSYDALTAKIIEGVPDASLLDTGNAALRAAISRLLAKNPSDRFPSADSAARALASALDIPLAESPAVRESFLQAAQFVGRGHELSRLRSALQQAILGQGSLWLVGGESGVGKSRLLDELRTRALVSGVQVMRGQAVADGGLPYQVWREVARRLVVASELSDLEAGVLKEIVPDIDTLLGRAVPDAPELEDLANRQRLELTLRDLLYRQPSPTLLLLEDLHWTKESLDMLVSLHQQLNTASVLAVGTFRDDERPDLPEQFPQAELLKLERLNESEIGALSASMLGDGGTKPGVINLLQRETEGNVFFVVEVVRTLAEAAGGLSDIGHMTLPSGVFAGGVQQVILRRLNRVPEQHQPLLKLAAIAGRQLDLGLIRILAGDLPLEGWLQTCSDAAVLEVKEDAWRFSHDKLREALLATLDTAERPDLYRRVATAFEQRHGSAAAYQTQLFDLWYQAGDRQKILETAIPAAREQRVLSNDERCRQIVDSALAAASDIATPETRLSLEILRVQALMGRREYADLLYMMAGILPRIRQAGLTQLEIRCLHLMSDCHNQMAHYDEALRMLSRAEELAGQLEDESNLARILRDRGSVYRKQGDLRAAAEALEKALAIYRRLERPDDVAACLNNLGLVYRSQGSHLRALDSFTVSYSISQQSGHRRGAFNSLNNVAVSHAMMGNLLKARDTFRETYAQAQTLDLLAQAAATGNLGSLHRDLGEYQDARRLLRETTEICRRLGITFYLVTALHHLAALERILGDTAAARQHAEEAYQIATEHRIPEQQALAHHEIGAILQEEGQYEAARAAYQEAIAGLEAVGSTVQLDGVLPSLGHLAEDEGDLPAALDWYRRGQALAEQVSNPAGQVEIGAHLAFVHLRQAEVDAARASLRQTADLWPALSSPVPKLPLLASLFALAMVEEQPLPNATHVWETLRAHYAQTPFLRRQRLPILEELLAQGPPLPSPATSQAPSLDELLAELADYLEE